MTGRVPPTNPAKAPMNLKSPYRQARAICAGILLTCGAVAHATITVTTSGYTNNFAAAPVAGDWITSGSNIAGTDTTFTTPASIDTFVITNNYNASTLGTALGTSATNPPSVNELARYNTALFALQMRPRVGATTTIKGANVLVAKMQNGTGGLVPSINVAYDFANPGAGIEEVAGWNAYYSVTGNSGWIKIPAFSTATPGNVSASLNFGGSGWSTGAFLYILWVDDNSSGGDANDGTGEASYTLDNFSVTVPVVPIIIATVSNASRGLGANPNDPSDDTVTFDVTITGTNLPPASPGWTTTGPIPAPPVTGPYGSTVTVPNVPLSALPLTVTLADQSNPSIVGNFTVTTANLPPYAAFNTIGAPALVKLDPSSAPQWVANGGTLTVVQNNGGGTTPFVASTTPITFAAGSTKFVSLVLEVQDASTGSNFETEDILKVELVTDVGTQVLTGLLDKNNSGFINGFSDSVANPYNTTPTADEFNRDGLLLAQVFTNTWRLHGVIPAGATSAQLVLTGLNNSGTEFYRVSNVVFGVAQDTDGDGVFDSQETVEGTNPADPGSFFRLIRLEIVAGNLELTVPTVSTRVYQLDTSTDLLIWSPQSIPVAGTNANMTFTTPSDTSRKFARVTVQ